MEAKSGVRNWHTIELMLLPSNEAATSISTVNGNWNEEIYDFQFGSVCLIFLSQFSLLQACVKVKRSLLLGAEVLLFSNLKRTNDLRVLRT